MRFFRKDKPGEYQGRHYTTYIDEVKQLKRDGKLDEAVKLLLALVDAVEAESKANDGWVVAPWYYEELAIVYAKQKNAAAELAILERFERQPHGTNSAARDVLSRLKKMRARK